VVAIIALAGVVVGIKLGAGGDSGSDLTTVMVTAAVPGGDAIAPGTRPRKFIFERVMPRPTALVRESSQWLLSRVPKSDRLQASTLESTENTAALSLLEESPARPWGELTTPAQRKIFKAFVADRALGEWLILLVDINVYGVIDPVLPTAYRWSRPEVEAYVACGIPTSGLAGDGLNACTQDFYGASDIVVMRTSAGRQGPSK
jgi:hypothetical protein